MACVYATLGTKVVIVEMLDTLIPNEDSWVGQLLVRELKKLGIETMTSKKVVSVDTAEAAAKVSLESGEAIEAEKVLVSVGRRAVCDKETIENLALQTDRGIIKVNKKMETNVPGVYAIGDAVGTTYLAHGAFAEAEVAAANAAGQDKKMEDYSLIPRAVYTFPEVASVGKNEKQCRNEDIDCKVGRSYFRSNGRSVGHNETVGEIRVISDTSSNKVLGVTMVGSAVTELACAARALIGSSEDILEVSFPHPTVSEVLKEAWEDAFGIGLHSPPK